MWGFLFIRITENNMETTTSLRVSNRVYIGVIVGNKRIYYIGLYRDDTPWFPTDRQEVSGFSRLFTSPHGPQAIGDPLHGGVPSGSP